MSHLQKTLGAWLLTAATGLASSTAAGISFGHHSGHHGGHGFGTGLHHGSGHFGHRSLRHGSGHHGHRSLRHGFGRHGHRGLHRGFGHHGRPHFRHRLHGSHDRSFPGLRRDRHRFSGSRRALSPSYFSGGSSAAPGSALSGRGSASPGSDAASGGSSTSIGGNGAGRDGWTTLADGDYLTALSDFGGAARANPEAGLPKAGYALASASAGDLAMGIRAMRRAFRFEPDALQALAEKPAVHPTIDALIEQYQYDSPEQGARRDDAFMLAALHYLKGDFEAADAAAARAAEHGDNTPSFRNLSRLLAAGSPRTGTAPSGETGASGSATGEPRGSTSPGGTPEGTGAEAGDY